MAKTSNYVAKTTDDRGFINYSPKENAVWGSLYSKQLPNIIQHAAPEYLTGFRKIDLPSNRVPQCADLSERLHDMTDWRVTPVPALIGFGRFFTMLSNREFPAASFIRSAEDFDYIQEPDIFHEIFGHTPLLTDPRFAHFSQAVGRAGVQAEAKDYSWLIRLYWFSIEFGLTQTNGVTKALGSGLASSPSELEYSVSSAVAERRPFDVLDILRTPYRIDIHQPIYFVLEDVDSLFQAAERDLLADVRQAQSLGLFAPSYRLKKSA